MIRIASPVIIAAVLLAVTPAVGAAQGEEDVFLNFGGGPTVITGDLGERFTTGWGPALGVTFEPSRIGFQFEYAYRWFNIPDENDIGRLSARHGMHQLDFNVIGNLTPRETPVRAYVLAGPGVYYRKVEITEYVGDGVICDPFLYLCGSYPVEDVIGSRGGWDLGFNVGGGVGIRMAERFEFYIESRYHYVWGPEVVSATPLAAGRGTGGKTNGEYWPITFGFRY